MEYSIKEVTKNIDITEQGLYKRIKSNFVAYKEKGLIVTKLIEQPSGTREQIFLTEEGIKDLLKTKQLRQDADLTKFSDLLNQVEQPTKPNLADAEAPKQYKVADAPSTELLKVLNQTIADLKAENKRLIEKLDKQELRFDEKLKEQKNEFSEAFNKQNEAYQKALNTISINFNNLLQRLPPPQEEATTEPTSIVSNKEPIKKKSFFSRLFNKE